MAEQHCAEALLNLLLQQRQCRQKSGTPGAAQSHLERVAPETLGMYEKRCVKCLKWRHVRRIDSWALYCAAYPPGTVGRYGGRPEEFCPMVPPVSVIKSKGHLRFSSQRLRIDSGLQRSSIDRVHATNSTHMGKAGGSQSFVSCGLSKAARSRKQLLNAWKQQQKKKDMDQEKFYHEALLYGLLIDVLERYGSLDVLEPPAPETTGWGMVSSVVPAPLAAGVKCCAYLLALAVAPVIATAGGCIVLASAASYGVLYAGVAGVNGCAKCFGRQ